MFYCDDEYIYLPEWYDPESSTIPLSHILCNNTPNGISTGNSWWYKGTKRQYNKIVNSDKKPIAKKAKA